MATAVSFASGFKPLFRRCLCCLLLPAAVFSSSPALCRSLLLRRQSSSPSPPDRSHQLQGGGWSHALPGGASVRRRVRVADAALQRPD